MESGDDRGSMSGGQAGALNRSRSINRQRLVAHSTAMESIQAESEPIDEEEDVPPGGIPARNAKGERLLMFLGVIDILQSYRLKKKLEHTWKSMIHDGDTVSVHRPGFYAQRFQDFMAKTVFKKIPSPLKHSPSKRRSISKGGRLGSLPCGGLQDADTAAPSSAEEEGGLMQSPHHAAGGSKPGSPTAAQQTVGFATPKVANSAGGTGSSTLSQVPPPSSPPPSPPTTVHYPAVLKGRPIGIGTAGSPAGSSTSTPGKPRIPPPVPPRSPKRPHHGQHQGSVRQGARGLHRPRAEEERGGALLGPGALTVARTSDFLSPSKHCSRPCTFTGNAPPQPPSPATKAMTPNCPPRRNRASNEASFGSPCNDRRKASLATEEGTSPAVPPRRSRKITKAFDASNKCLHVDKMEWYDEEGLSDELTASNCYPHNSVNTNGKSSSIRKDEKLGNTELTRKDSEMKIACESMQSPDLEHDCSRENSLVGDMLPSLDDTEQNFKEGVAETGYLQGKITGKIGINSNNLEYISESKCGMECNYKATTGNEINAEGNVYSKGSDGNVLHDLGRKASIVSSADGDLEESFPSVDKNKDVVKEIPHVSEMHTFSNLGDEEESFRRSPQQIPPLTKDKRLHKHQTQFSAHNQFCESSVGKYSKNDRVDFAEKTLGMGERGRDFKVDEDKCRSTDERETVEGFGDEPKCSHKVKEEFGIDSKFKVHQTGHKNSGFNEAEKVTLDHDMTYNENDRATEQGHDYVSESEVVTDKRVHSMTPFNHPVSEICDKSAQLKPEEKGLKRIQNAHLNAVVMPGDERRDGSYGTNILEDSWTPVVTSKLPPTETAFGMRLMNNSDAKETYYSPMRKPTFSHSNAVPKPFSRLEIHGFGRDQPFRSVLAPSSPSNCTASHVPSVVNAYVDLEDVI